MALEETTAQDRVSADVANTGLRPQRTLTVRSSGLGRPIAVFVIEVVCRDMEGVWAGILVRPVFRNPVAGGTPSRTPW